MSARPAQTRRPSRADVARRRPTGRPRVDRLEGRCLMAVSIIDFPVTTPNSQPYAVSRFSDGSIFLTQRTGNEIGKLATDGSPVAEFPIPTANSFPVDVVQGPDGNAWFTEYAGNKIGTIGVNGGAVTEYTVPTANSAPGGIAVGSDGALWFTENAGNKIGRITTAGAITEFTIPSANSAPTSIVLGADNNLYFTEYNTDKIGRITPAGAITEFTIPTAGSQPFGIASGNGSVYFAEQTGNNIGRLDITSGAFTEYAVPTAGSVPGGVTVGLDGNVYFTEQSGNNIGRVAADGTVTEYPVPTAAAHPSGIAYVPGGTLYFAEQDTNRLGRALLPGDLQFQVQSYSGVEGQQRSVTLTVTRTEGTEGTVSASFSTSDGTALSPEDYTATSGTVTFGPGDSTPKTITVDLTATGQLSLLPNKTFNVSLTNPTGEATLGPISTAQVQIINSFPRAVTVNDTSVSEGASTATFLVTLDAPSGLPISVVVNTADGTAKAGTDYTPITNQTITFAPGVTSQSVTVPILLDPSARGTRTFSLIASGATNSTIIKAQGVGSIVTDPHVVSVNDVSVNEDSGTATFLVTLDSPSGLPVTVVANTADGTARAGTDYTPITNQTITFAPGVTSQAVTVPILLNPSARGVETFSLILSAATNATLGKASGTAAIASVFNPLIVQGATVATVRNAPFTGVVATFTDPNPLAASLTSPAGSATIAWGDGTNAEAVYVPAGVTPAPGTSYVTFAGGIFTVHGYHVYNPSGTYGLAVQAFNDAGAAPTSTSASGVGYGQAVVSATPLTTVSTAIPIPGQTQGVPLKGVEVAAFGDPAIPGPGLFTGQIVPPGTFIATIDWGDGSPIAPGVVNAGPTSEDLILAVADASVGTVAPVVPYTVSGTHTYAAPGTYSVSTVIRSEDGAVITITNPVTVAATPLFLTGALTAASDSGVSHSDAITNVQQPVFVGFATPGSTVRYFAQAAGGSPFQIGQAAADASGFYTLQTLPILPDGSYTITAQVTDAFGTAPQAIQVLPGAAAGPLVIDTVGPEVTDVIFDRAHGLLTIGLRDDRSGLDRSTVIDGANYVLTRPGATALTLRQSGLSAPATSGMALQPVSLAYNNNKKLKRGVYTLDIRSGGIEDIAGNALDGEYYGYFPSGNDRPGSDFRALLVAYHNLTLAPVPIDGSASPRANPGTKPTTTHFPTTSTQAAKATAKHAKTVAHAKASAHVAPGPKGPAAKFGKGS